MCAFGCLDRYDRKAIGAFLGDRLGRFGRIADGLHDRAKQFDDDDEDGEGDQDKVDQFRDEAPISIRPIFQAISTGLASAGGAGGAAAGGGGGGGAASPGCVLGWVSDGLVVNPTAEVACLATSVAALVAAEAATVT